MKREVLVRRACLPSMLSRFWYRKSATRNTATFHVGGGWLKSVPPTKAKTKWLTTMMAKATSVMVLGATVVGTNLISQSPNGERRYL